MVDAMNAEVSLGTISNVSESIEWLGYTYLFGQYPLYAVVLGFFSEH